VSAPSLIWEGPQWPLLLDIFSGAGGAAWGYYQAGFNVIGVDHRPQENYPFPFLQADAMEVLKVLLAGRLVPFQHDGGPVIPVYLRDIAAIHLSPPCQFATVYRNNKAHVKQDHPNLIPAARKLAMATGLPYVIENVYGARAHLRDPVQLCGTSFGIEVRRHRLFESPVAIPPVPCDHGRFTERKYPGSSNRPNGRTVANIGEYRVPLRIQQQAIGISWMTLAEIAQAVPPAFTQYIGEQLLKGTGTA
jgi:DNA (cytosine-5)-methyltransferase 1